jgi:hypothetical protein
MMTMNHRNSQQRWIGALLLLLCAGSAQAFDSQAGKRLVDGNCIACHGSEVYTRPDHRVQSRAGLSTQVQRCQLALDLNWFDDEVENSAEYLNQEFYHFSR